VKHLGGAHRPSLAPHPRLSPGAANHTADGLQHRQLFHPSAMRHSTDATYHQPPVGSPHSWFHDGWRHQKRASNLTGPWGAFSAPRVPGIAAAREAQRAADCRPGEPITRLRAQAHLDHQPSHVLTLCCLRLRAGTQQTQRGTPASDDSSAGPSPADYRSLCECECERVLVTAGCTAGTWDANAGFAGVVSTPGSLKAGPHATHRESRKSPARGFRSSAPTSPAVNSPGCSLLSAPSRSLD
jgi:hypothetical protein